MTQERLVTPDTRVSHGPTELTAKERCCTPPAATAGQASPAPASQPCCGTVQEAADADSCCAPAAKVTAVATGVGCCG
jgi:hypothetical protein